MLSPTEKQLESLLNDTERTCVVFGDSIFGLVFIVSSMMRCLGFVMERSGRGEEWGGGKVDARSRVRGVVMLTCGWRMKGRLEMRRVEVEVEGRMCLRG